MMRSSPYSAARGGPAAGAPVPAATPNQRDIQTKPGPVTLRKEENEPIEVGLAISGRRLYALGAKLPRKKGASALAAAMGRTREPHRTLAGPSPDPHRG